MFTDALTALLDDFCTPADVRRIESGGDAAPLWQAVTEAGFLDLMVPESAGGAGLPLAELYDILALLGRHAVPVPLAASIAARALIAPGTPLRAAPLALATVLLRQPDGSLLLPRIPQAAAAHQVLVADGSRLLLLDGLAAQATPVGPPAGQEAPWRLPEGAGVTQLPGDGTALPALALAVQSALIAGAATRCMALTLDYANPRVQFGKALGKFQAVQQQLSRMAEHVAATCMAAEAAFQPGPDGQAQWLQAAIAKARCSEAAVLVADTAHALHGAIGVTQEYDLQLYTRRLRAWRVAHGSEAHWNQRIGEQVLADSASVLDTIRG